MRIPRIYHPTSLNSLTSCTLSEDGANHVGRVLRMQPGDQLELFDGSNHIYQAVINAVTKKSVDVDILSRQLDDRESPLAIHLGQVISRGERMEKKIQQWQKIAIAACEQCGRNIIPEIRPLMKLQQWCAEPDDALKLNLHPRASYSIRTLPPIPKAGVRLLIGSEGGLSPQEIAQTEEHDFVEVLLGKRVLRTETAAMAAITALQVCFGDLG